MMQNNRRVLMFGWELPPENTGGLGVACYGLARGMAQLGTQISFALPRKLRVNVPFMEVVDEGLEGVQITAINSLLRAYMTQKTYPHQLLRPEDNLYGQTIYDEAMRFGEMAKNWSASQPHAIIHAHDWMSYPAAIKAHAVSGRPWVAHIHATEYDRTDGHVNHQIAEIEYQGLSKADRVIAVSEYTKQTIRKRYSIAADKIEVIHNGVDMAEFEPLSVRQIFPHDKVVLFVGRLTFQKGVEYFLQAAAQVLDYRPDTVFIVAGAGDMEERLIMDAAFTGIGHRVLFPGFMSGRRLKELYSMADVFVMPSVSEPYGIVALEAVAAGVPVILSKQSGVVETLPSARVVDFWDTMKMSRMILSALDYPQLAMTVAGMARHEAERLTWEAAARKTLAVYQKVLS